MNARMLPQTILSATVASIVALALAGSPSQAQEPAETPTPSTTTTSEVAPSQHQPQHPDSGQMQQKMEDCKSKCKSMMNHGQTGSSSAHSEGQQGQHGHGSTNHNTAK